MNAARGRIVSPVAGEGRRLDSLDAWASALRPARSPAAAGSVPSAQGAAAATAAGDAEAFRPTVRPGMALVMVLDDVGDDGELVRMRGDRLVIGRSEGDLLVPHDISMSPRHALIERIGNAGWRLSDLDSGQGTFVRVASARLKHGTLLQIGSTRLRFQALDLTEGVLVEVRAGRDATRHECHAPSTTIGRADCGAGIGLTDPFVSPLHATVHRSPRGWRIENAGRNGLWVRIEAPVAMTVPSQFLCGEQRFAFQPLT